MEYEYKVIFVSMLQRSGHKTVVEEDNDILNYGRQIKSIGKIPAEDAEHINIYYT